MGKGSRGANRVNYFALWSFVFSATFASTLLMPKWHTIRYFGVGIAKLDIGIGLENLEIDLDCTSYLRESLALDEKSIADTQSGGWRTVKHVLSTAVSPVNKVCGWLQFIEGKHPLRYARELTCGLRQSVQVGIDFDLGCDLFNRAFLITKMLLVLVISAALLEFIAGVCVLTYWYSRPVKVVRQIAFICMVAAPALALGGVVMSGLVFQGQGGDLSAAIEAVVAPINKFLSGTPLSVGSVLREHKDLTQAYATFIFAGATVFSIALPIFFLNLFPIHKFEADEDETMLMEDQLAQEHERQKLLVYDPSQQGYDPYSEGQGYPENTAYQAGYPNEYPGQPQPGYGPYEQA
jgi:hypothetical protein